MNKSNNSLLFIVFFCFIEFGLSDDSTEDSAIIGSLFKDENSTIKSFNARDRFENSSLTFPITSYIYEKFPHNHTSYKCEKSLFRFLQDALELKPWVLEMVDASGKLPSSFLSETLMDFGSLENCVDISIPSEEERGQYCWLQLQHPLFQPARYKTQDDRDYVNAFGPPPDWISEYVFEQMPYKFGLYLGICVPSACSERELNVILNALAEPLAFNSSITDCQTKKEEISKQWPLSTKIAIFCVFCLITVCVIGTIVDLYDNRQPDEIPTEKLSLQLLKAFSFPTNLRNVFEIPKESTPLDFLYGLRLIFSLWVLLLHYPTYPSLWKHKYYKNFLYKHEFMEPKLLMSVINNGPVCVEPFFFLSGLLLAVTLWKRIERSKGNINFFEEVFKRYWRFTPTLLFVMLMIFILPVISSGPVWNGTWKEEKNKCFSLGWKNFLYIQNNSRLFTACIIQGWFLAVTMQLVVIFIPLLVLIYKYPKTGILLCFLLQIYSMVVVYNKHIEHSFPFPHSQGMVLIQMSEDFGAEIYMTTMAHFSPYFLGILSAFSLKYRKLPLSKVWIRNGWIFCTVCHIAVFYSVYIPTNDIRFIALFTTMRNTIYGLGLSWLTYACTSGYGGVLTKVLSWKALIPWSRMSFSAILVHSLYLLFRDGSLTERIYFDKPHAIVEIIPILIFSLLTTVLAFTTVEEPFNKVYNLLKNRPQIKRN